MVEFKDDGTATTPGKPRENRDAESQSWPIWWPSNWTTPA